MPLRIVQGDIAAQDCAAVVTAANQQLMGGGGVDGAIHRAAGPELLRAIRRIGGTPTGTAVITPAFELEHRGVQAVIHAVGPIWRGGHSGEADLLAGAYRRSLELAVEHDCPCVAFPSISTGVYGYPTEQAAPVALTTIQDFLSVHPELEVRMVLYDAGSLQVYQRALARLVG
ncbi:macro domain-containing protein [Deinococcus radiopugnans]|uniref:Macro domain-containing protein n=1 Tax=Deinococcus radiopugnans ATCC 19172 TaxID=585398 RepID=A0A5C4XWQ5_9DEIO|nr:macro domain-containing protein [Deinococcus radiopugnans]MBB6018434.1 O-acetyl-ADP-ribose deacetylase (regulator of RNase III) [Deinococcus radiopugnans ATCC 19172]TNM67557.1 macro domain-containing protein [Deinococcus radiopugnans ATCC 19172]